MFIEFVWCDLRLQAQVEFVSDEDDERVVIHHLACDGQDASFLLRSTHFKSIEHTAYVAAWMEDMRIQMEAA